MTKHRKATFKKQPKQTAEHHSRLQRRANADRSKGLPLPPPPPVTVADLFARAGERVDAVRGLIERVNGGDPQWCQRLHDRFHNPAGRLPADDTQSLSTMVRAILEPGDGD